MKSPVKQLHAYLLAACLGMVAACATPSVPIPPPDPKDMSFEVDLEGGTARFEYRATPTYAGAIVYVFNRDLGTGVITTADSDGAVSGTEPFPAQEGDEVVITFETASQFASTCVVLQDGPSSSAFECNL